MDSSQPTRLLWISAEASSPVPEAIVRDRCLTVQRADGIPEAIEYLKRTRIDVAVAQFPLPEWEPSEALEELKRADDSVPLIVWDSTAALPDAVRLMKLGAFDVLGAAAGIDELAGGIENAIADRSGHPSSSENLEEPWRSALVGRSEPFQEVVRLVRLVGNRRSTVLITGETGTGKEMAARAVHLAGSRGRLPMVSVCCSALPENLLEAELFGHVRGAFTGALNQRIGRFEQANGSTIFLDEIGDMPLELQAKLLRVLQEREFQRLGSSETIRADVRVIAATNADLMERVRQGRFREDLYYRLNVVPLHMPPLRARGSDVAHLTHHFIGKICAAESIPLKQITHDALDRLAAYSWPGNVRQLENSVERAVVLSGDRGLLYPSDFPLSGGAAHPVNEHEHGNFIQVPDDGLDFERTVGQIARGILEQALRKTNGNKKLAADLLRLKRTTLAAKLKSLDAGEAEFAAMPADFVHSA